MTVRTNAYLIAAFATGQRPDGDDFKDLIESKPGESGVLPAMGTKILVTATWATPANAKADIESATGVSFPADSAGLDIFVSLWEGSGDSDDFAVLHCGDTPAYVAQNGGLAPFASAPTTGYAYIFGTAVLKEL